MKTLMLKSAMPFLALAALSAADAGGGVAEANISTGEDRADPAAAEGEATTQPAPEPANNGSARKSFTPEQIKEIRDLRAEKHPDGSEKAGQPVWSHKKLGDKFGTSAGVISQIVRNRTYKDPEYTPVNDGK